MTKISRRSFLQKSVAGSAALALGASGLLHAEQNYLGPVRLGDTKVRVTRVAMGTGSNGWMRSSQQVRLGESKFLDLAQHAYDMGIRFFEAADIYGSHQFVRQALKYIPRDKVALETKVWFRPEDWIDYKNVTQTVDRFRKELGSDYLDIVLLHCQTDANWEQELQKEMDELSELKAKGIVGAIGVSCHDLGALETAATSPWVDVVQARINAFGPNMDAAPEKVMPVLQKAHANGKGVIGMKIYGCGECIAEAQRQKSLEYVFTSGNVDAITIGFSEIAHIDDTLNRVQSILAA